MSEIVHGAFLDEIKSAHTCYGATESLNGDVYRAADEDAEEDDVDEDDDEFDEDEDEDGDEEDEETDEELVEEDDADGVVPS
jgi:hypothetical protein